MGPKSIIYVVEHHHELLYLWRELEFKQISILHLDAHCDMHGLLVDREKGFSNAMSGLKRVDCGNFLSFGVIEGIVKDVAWVHDKYGGRNNDTTYVKYTTDLTAFPHLIRNRLFPSAKYPLRYSEQLLGDADRLEIGENVHLDIDWDSFYLKAKSAAQRRASVESFLAHEFQVSPQYTYVSYSADYVVPSRREFREFVLQLQHRFGAEIAEYSYPLPKKEGVSTVVRCTKDVKHGIREHLIFPLRRRLNNIGIY